MSPTHIANDAESAYSEAMNPACVGISDIAAYIPSPRIELAAILERRIAEDPALARRLPRAIESTGQRAIRFPESWEDSAALAGTAALRLLSGRDGLDRLRLIVAGTETTVDFSKPLSAYVGGMLKAAGLPLPATHASFQVQHACAGGTLGLLSVAALLAASGRKGDSGLVVCSDIARYQVPSSAEFTQGAGAVALLVENVPKLVDIDLATIGYSSADVDDFFRPLDSVTAKVRGQYSMQCYNAAAEQAFSDHCARRGKSPAEVLESTDIFVFHVPFAKMAYTAARQLLSQHLGLIDGAADAFLEKRHFFKPLETTAEVGNIYTGASFLNLQANLLEQWRRRGEGIIGKRVLFTSYGSGNTMAVISMTVQPGAPAVIATWDGAEPVASARPAGFEDYLAWLEGGAKPAAGTGTEDRIPAGRCYLKSIREDGYREYAIKT
jgi:hydroxymethylglutaryl-CoA synthase